ncbi:MAG: DUF1775 domain-containing protein [Actinomycetota bacterium]
MRRAVATVFLSLVLVPQAFGHAEITPAKVSAGGLARLVLHVEGEESLPAVKIAVQLPPSLSRVSFDAVPGWKRTQRGQVVTWSGSRIANGNFGEFVIRARMPAKDGTELLFPTVQTYADGNVVHWIGAESSDTPAPRVVLTAGPLPNPAPPPPTTTTGPSEKADGDSHAAIWLLAAAGLVLLAAAAVLVRRRRS